MTSQGIQLLGDDGRRSVQMKWVKRLVTSLFILVILWQVLSVATYTESDEVDMTSSSVQVFAPLLTSLSAEEYTYSRESELAQLSDHDRELNLEYCGQELCKWFFVYKHPEQESRAQKWFRVFTSGAQMLNRTVVLSHVGNSRIRSCSEHPFDFFYDVDAVRERYPNMTFVDQDRFVEWTLLRDRVPTMRLLNITINNDLTSDLLWRYTNLDTVAFYNGTCLDNARLALEPTPVNTTELEMTPLWWSERERENKVRGRIVSNIMATNPDVVLLESMNIHTTIFTGAKAPPIPYARPIYDTAERLSNTYLRPFVAIHWRMELAPLENLPACAEELVNFLPQFMAKRGIKNVYLATDYPVMGGDQAQSDTFLNLSDAHHEAFRIVNASLSPLTWISVRDADARANGPEGVVGLGDGLEGIIDKLVCTRAEYFFIPPSGCRKPTSSWTTAVIDERKMMMQEDIGIKNEFDEWSTLRDFSTGNP